MASVFSMMLPILQLKATGLIELTVQGQWTGQTAPVQRWDAERVRSVYTSASYGAFIASGGASTDSSAFGISNLEAQTMDPQLILIMQAGYAALQSATGGSVRAFTACRG